MAMLSFNGSWMDCNVTSPTSERAIVKLRVMGAAVLAVLAVFIGPGFSSAAYASAYESHTNVVAVTVANGDTKWRLAQRWCGAGWKYRSVSVRSTSGMLRGDWWIYAGDRATISCAISGTAGRSAPVIHPSASGWTAPLPGRYCINRASGCWGAPRDGHWHHGIDIRAPYNTAIHAVHAGTVIFNGYEAGGAGWYIKLAHGGGVYTIYMHLIRRSALPVKAHVDTGKVIGYVGATGDASGPHLHFQTHVGSPYNWGAVNPSPFMRNRGVSVGC